MLRIYDTAARAKVDFVPRVEGAVSIYECGPTPYDAPHIGHGRTAVSFDTIRRYFGWLGYRVTYVKNVTDVEDRIIARAAERGVTEPELARTYEDDYWAQMDRLNVLRPDDTPHATAFIEEMQRLIAELLAAGHAYVIEGQGVYFQVDTLPEYGALSRRTLDELLESAGARVEVDEEKRSPVDFALWKAAKPGEPQWDSPWGPGRPGWHIECSAMSLEILGDGFDIHGGGDDLVFPHHENEIAQAVGAGHEFARHWLHAGMVNTQGVKMSKSLGNFVTLQDVLDRFDPRAFRLLILQTHYRRQMEFGEKELVDAEKAVERLDALVRTARRSNLPAVAIADPSEFKAAMDDDFDTPAAVAVVFDLVRRANTALASEELEAASALVGAVWELTGVLGLEPHDDVTDLDDEIAGLVTQRDEARAGRDFARADELRDELRVRGIVLED
ncbi:MAG: cysteine--tRNA ligase, partial [Acidimicrobiia bacterium]